MKVLDCESIDSTYESLKQILGTSRSRLESLFEDIDIESFYRDNPHHPQPAEDLIFSEVRKLATLHGNYDRTCWFHVSRTLATNAFEQGILPLGQCLDAIWNLLYSLARKHVSAEEWREFRHHMGPNHHADLYRMRSSTARQGGPYALLTRDHAFKPEEIGNHDYFSAPEIVEDICICFSEKHGFDLLAAFKKKTKPCVVKFFDGPQGGCIETAVYHLYKAYWHHQCSQECNACYDGKGVPIPPQRIMTIEFPIYRKRRRRKMAAEATAASWEKDVEELFGMI